MSGIITKSGELSCSTLVVFLSNYWVHSTALLLCALACMGLAKRLKPDVRSLVWKFALVGPVFSALVVTWIEVPHGGYQWAVERAVRSEGAGIVHRAALRDAATADAEIAVREASLWGAHRGRIPRGDWGQHAASDRDGSAGLSRPIAPLLFSGLLSIWACGLLVTGWLVLRDSLRLVVARRFASAVADERSRQTLESFRSRAGIRRRVSLLEIDADAGPFVAGAIFPVIFVPRRFFEGLEATHRDAILAHEVAHLARRDPLWNLVTGVICGAFLFQPLNLVARRRLKVEAELLADWSATRLLGGRMPLADCLTKLGDWLVGGEQARSPLMSAGMGHYRSFLGQRVEALLEGTADFGRSSRRIRFTCCLTAATVMLACVGVAPRAIAEMAAAGGATAASPAHPDSPEVAEEEEDAAAIPESFHGFRGMLLGRLVSRDIERGEFTVTIDYVPRVWRNNEASEPRSVVGRTVDVEGVTGKWIDQLLLLKTGETLAFEAQHIRGDRLRFPGEWLRKSDPYRPEDYPVPPDDFRGFHGFVSGRVEKKHEDALELVLQVSEVEPAADGNQAEHAASAVGRNIIIAGFWQPAFRAQFDALKAGTRIRLNLTHPIRQSDHFSAVESMTVLENAPPADSQDPSEIADSPATADP